MASASFESDIRPLFREYDIDSMRDIGGFDLSSLEDVRAHADEIYERLSDKSMPCDEPWPDDRIARFKEWIDGGMAQ